MTGMAKRIDGVIEKALAERRIVGTVILISIDGKPAYRSVNGFFDREAGTPMRGDAIFRLASLSKPIVATAALWMIDTGLLGLDEPTTRWLPDFKPRLPDGATPPITIRQLLTHTSGLGYAEGKPGDPYRAARISGGADQPGLGMEENLARLASVPLFHAPGTAWRYGMSIDVLGAVMAKAQGSALADAVATYITRPLGMKDTAFSVTDLDRLAKPYADAVGGAVAMDDPHEIAIGTGKGMRFAPSRILNPASFQSGGSGMVGTAADFVQLVEALRTGRILPHGLADAARTNQVGSFRDAAEPGTGFGFFSGIIVDPARAKVPYSAGTLRWGGVYGHNWFIDRAAKISALVMSNTALEGCNGPFAHEVRDAIYGALK